MARRAHLTRGTAIALAGYLFTTLGLQAQNISVGGGNKAPDPNIPLSFEVATIKPNKEGGTNQSIRRQPGGLFTVVNMPVRTLITFAYQLQSYQLVGGPSWVGDDRFDIVAKMAGDPPPVAPQAGADHMMLATRTLLAERFKLVLRRETRELDIYALTMARPGGKPGPAMKVSTQDCSPEALKARAGAAPNTLKPIFCGIRASAPGKVSFSGMPISFYTTFLAGPAGRFVVDRTGIEGNWDFDLSYAPPPPVGQLPPGATPPPIDTNLPDLFTAVQEQLGLRLQATKGPVDVIVIESIQQPIPD